MSMAIDLLRSNRKVIISILNDNGAEVGSLDFDCVVTENHDLVVESTSHPSEDGIKITDNIVNMNEILSLDIIISNDPYLSIQEIIQLGTNRAKNLIDTGSFGDYDDRAFDGYNALKALQKDRSFLRIQTHLEIYDNMILKRIGIPRNNTTQECLKCTLDFEEIRIVKSVFTGIPDKYLEKKTVATTSSGTVKGRIGTTSGSEELVEKVEKTELKKIVDFFVGE